MNKIKTTWYIHGFALLHALTTVVCTLLDTGDSIPLTALTMALAVIICRKENLTVEITIISIVLVNILGFVLGNLVPQGLQRFMAPLEQHATATFLITELLGWSLYGFAHSVTPDAAARYERQQSWQKHKDWLIIALALLMLLRIYIELNYPGSLLQESGVIGLLGIVTFFSLAYMASFAIRLQREASRQRTRRHQAEFRYMALRNQVNPHFLFNCLNVLDSIVQDGMLREASDYIHKMSAVYRYLMQHEEKHLVSVQEEIDFAGNYRDLMQIRFPEGLVIEDRVSPAMPQGFIVPCTLQLLLENAIKHNVISPERPLRVTLSSDGKSLSVRNNRIPKSAPAPSTGIGLQYIRNRYRDIAGAEIDIVKTADSFSVTLPILAESE